MPGSVVAAVHHAVVAGAAAALVALAVALFLLWRRRRAGAAARSVAAGSCRSGAAPAALPVFRLADVERATDGFHPSRVLGQGRHFTVYAAAPGLAAKRMHPHLVLGDAGGRRFPAAVRSLAVPSHRNLAAFVGLAEGPGERVLLVERAPAGSVTLDAILHGGAPAPAWGYRAAIAAGAARGLAHLHEHGVVHGRVRPCNVLVDADAVAAPTARRRQASRVSDYGLATFLDHDDDGGDGDRLDVRAENDVYMFGALLLELLTGRRWDGGRLAEWALPRIRAGAAAEVTATAADKAEARLLGRVARVALACLGNDGRSRPGMAEVSAILDDVEAAYRRRGGAAAQREEEEEEEYDGGGGDGDGDGDGEGRLSGCLLGPGRSAHKADKLLRPPV